MSDFDSTWDQAFATLNKTADDILADRILYAIDGNTYVVMQAYVLDADAGVSGVEELDTPVANRKRIKISKDLVAMPLRTHRLHHPRLGDGVFQPVSEGLPQTVGAYWLFEVQKV